MANVAISGDTSGAVTLTVPSTVGTQTATFPAATGTVMVSCNQPAFSVTNNANQSISGNTTTKIAFQTKVFDTANAFDSTTNYRFQPTVAGYYQLNATISLGTAATITQATGQFQVSGSNYGPRLFDINPSASLTSNSWITLTGSLLVYLNGSTNYVEVYAYIYPTAGTIGYNGGANICQFSGSLVRAS